MKTIKEWIEEFEASARDYEKDARCEQCEIPDRRCEGIAHGFRLAANRMAEAMYNDPVAEAGDPPATPPPPARPRPCVEFGASLRYVNSGRETPAWEARFGDVRVFGETPAEAMRGFDQVWGDR